MLKKMLIAIMLTFVVFCEGCVAIRGVAYTSSLTIDEIGPNYGNLELRGKDGATITTKSRKKDEYASSANTLTSNHSGGSAADELNKRAHTALRN